MARAIRHPIAIDFEGHFQIASSGRRVAERHWDKFPDHMHRTADAALTLLARHNAKATFFVGDWAARRYGLLLAKIVEQGHEVACHFDLTRKRDKDALSRCAGRDLKNHLEAVTGRVVQGCKLSNSRGMPGDAAVVAAAGFRYVSIAKPIWGSQRDPVGTDTDARLPRIATPSLRLGGQDVACASGTSLRLLPAPLLGRFAATWQNATAPKMFTFKLWELDPDVQRLAILTRLQRLLCYRNLSLLPQRLECLLKSAEFVPLRDHFGLADEPIVRPAEVVMKSPEPIESEPGGAPVAIVVPCFNEEAGLAYLGNALFALDAGLGRRHALTFVLVDDGSTDGTWSEMHRLFGQDDRFKLLQHEHNKGIGRAIFTGIMAADCETVAVMDSDCSYDPSRIEEMLPLLGPDVAIVTASPYHSDGGVEGVPQWRLALSRMASRLYRMVLKNKLATYTSCFRVCRKSAIERLVLRHEGYIGVVEMLARLDLAGWRIVEHPVVLEARLLGSSKLRILRVTAGHLRFLSEISAAQIVNYYRANSSRVTW